MPLNPIHLQHILFTSAVLSHASSASNVSPKAGPHGAATPTPSMPFLCASSGVCLGFSSPRSLPVVVSNDVWWQGEEERNPPSSAFPVTNSQGSHAWPADCSLVFALAQTIRASALERPRSVTANSILQISHMDCAALFRPHWDCFPP